MPSPTPASRFLRGASALMGLVFLFAVVVQYNDPDALAWMVLYAAAAVACGLAAGGRLPARGAVPALVAGAALVWAGALVVADGRLASPTRLFGAWEMADDAIERSREVGGLVIVTVWMSVLAGAAFRQRRAASAEERDREGRERVADETDVN
jgi:RsiW-degrading membrane proteinase PrsW (M82 family)